MKGNVLPENILFDLPALDREENFLANGMTLLLLLDSSLGGRRARKNGTKTSTKMSKTKLVQHVHLCFTWRKSKTRQKRKAAWLKAKVSILSFNLIKTLESLLGYCVGTPFG